MKIDVFPGVLEKVGLRYVLSDAQESWFRRWFPEVENGVLQSASGMSHSTLHRFARQFGLKKSEKGMKGIKKRQASAIKRTCERNGYYDSIRGRRPSQACVEGTARMWQDVRDGLREHPMKVLKAKNPRRYNRLMKKKSESRKELIRKEVLRVIYGLERKTKLPCVVVNRYTRRQVGHRYYALKRGYMVAEDCSESGGERWKIYYDDATERSEEFEKNLKEDGFDVCFCG